MNFLADMTTLALPTYDDGVLEPPRIYWHNGDRRSRTPGTFYTNRDTHADAVGHPWEPVARFDGEQGASCALLKLAILGFRMQPFLIDPNTQARIWLQQWERGAVFQTDILCLAEGIQGPVVWATKGMTSAAFGAKGGILEHYRTGLLRAASTAAGRSVPLWTFWLPITTTLGPAGVTLYKDTGHGSMVTPPMLHPQVQPTEAVMNRLYVGKAMVEVGSEIRREFDGWLKQRRGNAAPVPVTTTAAPDHWPAE